MNKKHFFITLLTCSLFFKLISEDDCCEKVEEKEVENPQKENQTDTISLKLNLKNFESFLNKLTEEYEQERKKESCRVKLLKQPTNNSQENTEKTIFQIIEHNKNGGFSIFNFNIV
jgi:hypothetical protein